MKNAGLSIDYGRGGLRVYGEWGEGHPPHVETAPHSPPMIHMRTSGASPNMRLGIQYDAVANVVIRGWCVQSA